MTWYWLLSMFVVLSVLFMYDCLTFYRCAKVARFSWSLVLVVSIELTGIVAILVHCSDL